MLRLRPVSEIVSLLLLLREQITLIVTILSQTVDKEGAKRVREKKSVEREREKTSGQ